MTLLPQPGEASSHAREAKAVITTLLPQPGPAYCCCTPVSIQNFNIRGRVLISVKGGKRK